VKIPIIAKGSSTGERAAIATTVGSLNLNSKIGAKTYLNSYNVRLYQRSFYLHERKKHLEAFCEKKKQPVESPM